MAQIQTIEGLDATRSVLAVKENKAGYCQASAFGPPGSGRADFKTLCEESKLTIGVGKGKSTHGPTGQRRSTGMAKNMEFPPLEDLGQDFAPEFFELGQLMTPEQMKASLVSALAGGGGILVTANILERIDYFADSPRLKALAAVAVGLVGGRLMWQDNDQGRQNMAMGFVGGVAGMGLAKLVSGQFDVPGSLSAVGVDNNIPPYQFFSPTRGPVRQFFGADGGGLSQPIVTDDDPIALDAVEVTADQLGSWMG